MKLRELGEFAFLEELRDRIPQNPRVLLGLGDDCALLAPSGKVLATTDSLVEGVHFLREWTSLESLGRKAFAVNASDIAAMGGEPTFALLSLGLPPDTSVEELHGFFQAFVAEASRYQAVLVGGNLSASPCLSITVTLLGRAPYGILTRRGMRAGEDLYVTGTLGDAALGLRLLREGKGHHPIVQRFLEPLARVRTGQLLAQRRLATAMIDISDGLLQDLGHLCAESRVGAVIEGSWLPLSSEYKELLGSGNWELALTGGEDYELLFSAPPGQERMLKRVGEKSGCPITRIGRVVEGARSIEVRDQAGLCYRVQRKGHDHFLS